MENIKSVKVDVLKQWLASGEAALFDVREPDEYRHEHIAGATNIPLDSLAPESFFSGEDKKIVLQCNSGNRSLQAARKIQSAETPVFNLTGGIQDWKKAGFPVVKQDHAVLPLMRQVQVVVGLLVLVTLVLGYFIHPAFLLATAFIGGGLLNAGLTGWCGMAKILGQMPWNKR